MFQHMDLWSLEPQSAPCLRNQALQVEIIHFIVSLKIYTRFSLH